MVIFENKDHVKVLQMKLHTFEMYQLNILKGGNKWRLLTEYTQNQLQDVTGEHSMAWGTMFILKTRHFSEYCHLMSTQNKITASGKF